MQTDAIFDILFDKQREKYLNEMREQFVRFMQKPKQLKTNLFMSFTSWHDSSFEPHQALFNGKNCDIQEGGYYISVDGTGICINPSPTFFEEFCQKGFSLHDIDIVIATTAQESIQDAVKKLYRLNRECTRTLVSYGHDAHIIRFFLHPELYTTLSSLYRPIIREELGSIQSLQTFTKSNEEKPLANGISLSYCNTESQNVAIRIDYPDENISLGLASLAGFNASIEQLFAPCSILIGGIGQLSSTDLEKVELQSQSLGYFGLCQIAENSPNLKLLLVSEFARSMGDVRLELMRKLKRECSCVVLPIDSQFSLQLDAYIVQTESKTFASYEDVKVIRSNGPFSRLIYLGQEDVL